MHLSRLILLSFSFIIPVILRGDDQATQKRVLFEAAASGDVSLLQRVLPGIDPNLRNSKNQTALMVAAQSGHFDAARFLLWQGADANLEDPDGLNATRYLLPGNNGFAPLNLLLRCYAFVQENGSQSGRAKQPNLVVVNDNYIDYKHPDLKGRYFANEAELRGRKGKDDDSNGFIDDVYGWNSNEDTAVTIPLVAILKKPQHIARIREILEEHEGAGLGASAMKKSYNNPFISETGFSLLKNADIDANDYVFANMLLSASHGTHVSGIVLKNSNNQALLHAITIGYRTQPKKDEWEEHGAIIKIASESASYTDFVESIRKLIIDRAYKTGKRSSKYLDSTGAGVVNMSYSRARGYYTWLAAKMQEIYRERGKDPASMELYACPIGVDLCSDLALELLVANAASFALMMYENPDTLFVLAAGNEGENNDMTLPSPTYLSRFFSNAITVGSHDHLDRLSEFSNYGQRSVQITAPGESIQSALLGGFRGRKSGTSMAAPAVAGAAARIRADYPKLTAAEVRRIIERSGRKVAGLDDKIHSGAALDVEAALKQASNWRPGLEPLNDTELGRLTSLAPLPDGPKIKILKAHPGQSGDPLRSGDTYSTESLRITSVAGFEKDSWRVILSKRSGLRKQIMIPVMKSPWDHVVAGFSEGYEVTSLGGDPGGWAVVMTSDRGKKQQSIIPYDQTRLAEHMKQGYAITAAAGWQNNWNFALTTGTGLGKQRYSLPSDFDANRKSWIKARHNEGYRITDIAGDNTEKGKPGSWVVVMSQNSGFSDQVHNGIGPWPTDWIKQKFDQGFRITNIAGFANRWIVVMSKGTGFGGQEESKQGPWPMKWVGEKW